MHQSGQFSSIEYHFFLILPFLEESVILAYGAEDQSILTCNREEIQSCHHLLDCDLRCVFVSAFDSDVHRYIESESGELLYDQGIQFLLDLCFSYGIEDHFEESDEQRKRGEKHFQRSILL